MKALWFILRWVVAPGFLFFSVPSTFGCLEQYCIPRASTHCDTSTGTIYWADSCGNIGDQKEQCQAGCDADPADTCRTSLCTNGQVQCNSNIIQTCTNNEWVDSTDCSVSGNTCANGACTVGGCTKNADCTGANQYCELSTHTCKTITPCTNGQTQCIGNELQTCTDSNWVITDCSALGKTCVNGACVDGCTDGAKQCSGTIIQTCSNASWVNGTDCSATQQICDLGVCTSSGLCPAGLFCNDINESGDTGCLDSSGNPPPGAQTGCGQGNPPAKCNASNNGCWCLDDSCLNTVCIESCGTCASGLTCVDVDGSGDMGCVDSRGKPPPGAQTGCTLSNQPPYCAQPNNFCWCTNSRCTATACFPHCSRPR